MVGSDTRTARGAEPLPIKDVTKECITKLKQTPYARAQEGYFVSGSLPNDLLIPQADESTFLKTYVSEQILKEGKLDLVSTDLFPNYVGRVFEIEDNGVRQLVLVGISNDLGANHVHPTCPFLVYVPPSPQDNPKDHRRLRPDLYARTADADIPVFYSNLTNYPYSWDWLFFQFHANLHRLSYQLKKAGAPYVFVVPQLKSFSDGLGLLASPALMERFLLGVQKFYFDEVLHDKPRELADLRHVTLAAFSVGNALLNDFLQRGRQHPFVRDAVRDLVLLDPPPGNPKNRPPVVDTVMSILRADRNKRVLLYAEDPYYVQRLVDGALGPKGVRVDLNQQKIFSDPKVASVFFAFLEAKLFTSGVQDPLLRNAHNTFPNLFVNDAVRRSALTFRGAEGKLVPHYDFLDWAP